MKKNFIICLLCIVPLCIYAQKSSFEMNGKIISDTIVKGTIYLQYEDNGTALRDSCIIKNNTYHFKGMMEDGALKLNLWANMYKKIPITNPSHIYSGFAQLYVTPGIINIVHKDKFTNSEVQGSTIQADNVYLNNQSRKKNFNNIIKIYIIQHPDSWLSYVWLEQLNRVGILSKDTAAYFYAHLSPALKKYTKVKELGTRILGMETAIVGNPAIEFTLGDVNDKTRFIILFSW